MRYFFLFLACVPGFLWAGEGLQVDDPWMREMPPGQRNAAIYLTLHNRGDKAVIVRSAESPLASRLEFHSSVQVDGQWRMQALEQLEIAPGRSLSLSPGGVHLMVFGVRFSPREGDAVPLVLELDDGTRVSANAEVRSLVTTDSHHHH